jgi:Domain of unknown function (DUF4259)
MGTWDIGAFDNDMAADWCGDLDDADPAMRPQMIADALSAVVDELEYIDNDEASVAVAAAAIVASQPPRRLVIESPYAPEFLRTGDDLKLSDGLPMLASRALERITGDESEWRDLWSDSGKYEEALAEIDAIQAALST